MRKLITSLRNNQTIINSVCLLRLGVQRVFVLLCVLDFVWAIFHGGLKLDMSALFTTFFI